MRKYESIKKIDLHCDLVGSIDLDLIAKWLKVDKSKAKELMTFKKTKDYPQKISSAYDLLQTKTHLKEATECLIESLFKENIIHAEIYVYPLLHTKKSLDIEEVILSILSGLNDKISAKIVLVINREDTLTDSKKIINLAKKYQDKGIAGISLCGDEVLYPTRTFESLLKYAKDKDVPFTIHVNPNANSSEIDDAIEYGATRVCCGLSAIKSFKTMESLKKYKVPLEICFTKDIDENDYKNINDHPVSRLIDSGVPIVISSGMRTITRTDLSHEYYLLNKAYNISNEYFKKMNRLALESSLFSKKEKMNILS